MPLAQTVTFQKLRDLHPDPRNPRLPKELREWENDEDLLVYIANSFNSVAIADSIALHDYFPSEPMVVTEENGRLAVLEGNRRLAALLGLARPELRERYDESSRWEEAANRRDISLNLDIPVVMAGEREDADPLLGFRHIGGVLDWKPLQRAEFIAYLVDERGQSFLDAADSVGEEEAVVRMLYRNQAILSKARDLGAAEVTENGTRRFGIFTAALNRNPLRAHIGVARAADVQERESQFDEADLPKLVELSSWLYGTDGDEKVIEESRDLSRLAQVVNTPPALDELRRTRDLDAAYAMTPGPPRTVIKQLAMGVGHLRAVVPSIDLVAGEPRVEELAAELSDLTRSIREAVESGDAGAH
jgi:hypothetical protein